jgi:hypothetical protein
MTEDPLVAFVRKACSLPPDDRGPVWLVAADYLEEVGRVGESLACRWVAEFGKRPWQQYSLDRVFRYVWWSPRYPESHVSTHSPWMLPQSVGERVSVSTPRVELGDFDYMVSYRAVSVRTDDNQSYLDLFPHLAEYLHPTRQEAGVPRR